MSLKSILLFAAAAMGHTIHSRATKFGCGAPEPTEEQLLIAQQFGIQEAALRDAGMSAKAAISVKVYLHSVASSSGSLLSDSTLKEQFDVLAGDYSPLGITMTLAGTTKTVNPTWSSDGNELAMKRALRKGTYADLNVYFLEDLGGNLGYCYFPTDAAPGSQDFILDGCSVLAASVPGGSADQYNLGKTATHEAGHWFGLYHTFQGGCNGAGDSVGDTPAQAGPSSGCPVGRDSCPNKAGLDPIHNYMDYSVDACYEEFTSGQSDRIASFWSQYRA